jgi:Ser/Thr protein kinase RdoA (MazF antagonist)
MNPSNVLEIVLQEYGATPGKNVVTPVNNGLINHTWQVNNTKGVFILQEINQAVFKDPMAIAANIRKLADHLAEKDPSFLFVAPIRTRKNEEMVHHEGKGYFRLFPFVQGSHTIREARKPAEAYEAAKAFGRFTRLLSDFPINNLQITLPDFHNLSLRYRQFSEAIEHGNSRRIQQSAPLIGYIKKNKQIVDTYEAILNNPAFRLRVTHHDTKISNVLFNDHGHAICIIDLDTVMRGYFISDVGDMIRTYLSPVSEEEKNFSKIEVRPEYFRAIVDGYMREMGHELSAQETKHFIYAGKFMIYMQAMRFLTDHLNNDVYYGANYEGHNLVRAGNQAAFLEKLVKMESDLSPGL